MASLQHSMSPHAMHNYAGFPLRPEGRSPQPAKLVEGAEFVCPVPRRVRGKVVRRKAKHFCKWVSWHWGSSSPGRRTQPEDTEKVSERQPLRRRPVVPPVGTRSLTPGLRRRRKPKRRRSVATVLIVKGTFSIFQCWTSCGCQGIRCFSMALSMVSNLCMHAVRATFLTCPAVRSRS